MKILYKDDKDNNNNVNNNIDNDGNDKNQNSEIRIPPSPQNKNTIPESRSQHPEQKTKTLGYSAFNSLWQL